MSFDSPFEKESEKDTINHKIQNFFEHRFNIEKKRLKYVDDLKLLANMNYQIKLFENKTEILQEIINQKCHKCRMKLLEEMNSRSKTPTQTSHFHAQNHKQIQTNRSVTPKINSHNIRRKEKVTINKDKPTTKPITNKKMNLPSSPDLTMKKKNAKKQPISKSPVPYNHMRLYTSVSKEKGIVQKNNKVSPKKQITIDTSSPAITNTVKKAVMTHKALTPTMTLHKKKKKMNNEEREKKQKKEKESLKESIQQLKESVKLVNDSVNKCEQKQKTTPIKRTNITPKAKNNPLSSNKDKSISPSLAHRTIQSNVIEPKNEIVSKLKEEKKTNVKSHKAIQSTLTTQSRNTLTTNTINTLSSSSSSQSTIKRSEDLPLQMSSKVKNQIQTSKIVKKVNKQNIHPVPKQVNTLDNDNSTIKEENEETRLSSVKNTQSSYRSSTNKKSHCLLLLIKSGYLSINKTISLVSSCPLLYKEFPLTSLLKEKITYIESVLHKISDFISKHDISQFNKPLIFSSTTQSSLNLIKKEDEYVLSHKIQPKEVLNLFTIIYIILDENYFKIPTQNLILNLVNVLLKKYNVDSISKFIFIYNI